MERILTKEEISELLSAVHSGEIETETNLNIHKPDESVKRLDLIRASLGSGRWQHANFDILLDSFARNYGISLTNRLQRSATIKRGTMESEEFDPLLLKFSDKGAIGVTRLDPLSHGGLFIIDSTLSYILVETMLGGTVSEEPLVPDRSLTTIEMNLVRNVMENACADLQKAFSPLESINTSLVKIESDPRMVNFVPPETEMMVVNFIVSIDTVSGSMILAIPFTSLEPLRDKIKDGLFDISANRDNSWTDMLDKAMTTMEVEVAAQLRQITLPIKDILDLQEGDIIDLNYDPNSPLRLLVEGQPKYFGQAGIRNGKKSVNLTRTINQGEQNGNSR